MNTKNESKHTPTPWIFKNTEAISGTKKIDAFQIVCPISGTVICSGLRRDEGQFIVRAVNSHEALVNTLKVERERLFKHFQNEQREAFTKGQAIDLWPEIKRMDEVIALAEGKGE